ncbi:MAG: hypothetical protein WAN86_04800 [Hyphomicrobiaceae bacterium]
MGLLFEPGVIAETFTAAGGLMTGEAREIVDEREPAASEFAIAVTDRWCGSV